MGNLVDSSLLDSLGFLFGQRCTIQRKTKGRSTSGEVTETWADLSGHVSIPCVISADSKNVGQFREVASKDFTFSLQTYKVLLQGFYPSITEEDRLVSDGKTYQISAASSDSQSVMTTIRATIQR